MRPGKKLLWLVFGTGLAGLIPVVPYGPALASNGQVNNAVMDIVCADPIPIATASPQ